MEHFATFTWFFILLLNVVQSLNWNNLFSSFKVRQSPNSQIVMSNILNKVETPSWDELKTSILTTSTGQFIANEEKLRQSGEGLPHTDAKLRLFGSTKEPRLTFYRDTAAWCPYCQKVWILLEEKKIPYKVEKINMRAYGDKPPEFLRMVC